VSGNDDSLIYKARKVCVSAIEKNSNRFGYRLCKLSRQVIRLLFEFVSSVNLCRPSECGRKQGPPQGTLESECLLHLRLSAFILFGQDRDCWVWESDTVITQYHLQTFRCTDHHRLHLHQDPWTIASLKFDQAAPTPELAAFVEPQARLPVRFLPNTLL
jgi:hypothetical protein